MQLLPFVEVGLAVPPDAPAGNTHQLDAYCSVGGTTVLAHSIWFTPETVKGEAGNAGRIKGFFVIPVGCALADLVRVEIKRDGHVLASRERSASPPAIELLSPAGGEVLGASPLLARWTASDPDGGLLTYRVQFSPDGGQSWQTLAFDWPGTEFPLSGDDLPATANALLRVVASDGFNATASQSPAPFTVLNHAPEVTIISPPVGPPPGNFFGGDVPLVLEALVNDLEDGALPDGSVTWSSDLDGVLGKGTRLELRSAALSAGTHLIAVSASDSAGATRSASVQITVSGGVALLGFNAQPACQTAIAGQSAKFIVVPAGIPPPPIRWQVSTDAGFEWANLSDDGQYSGTESATLVVNSTAIEQSGYRFRAVVFNATGSVASSHALLSVNAPYFPPSIDSDGNNAYDALTDGLLLLRYLSGLNGTALTTGALGGGAIRTDPEVMRDHLDAIRSLLDLDGNGLADAVTDGLMLIRYLFGLRGAALIDGAIGTGARRTSATDIESYIQTLLP